MGGLLASLFEWFDVPATIKSTVFRQPTAWQIHSDYPWFDISIETLQSKNSAANRWWHYRKPVAETGVLMGLTMVWP